MGDAKLMIDIAKLQIRKIEGEISFLANALRETTNKAESNLKK